MPDNRNRKRPIQVKFFVDEKELGLIKAAFFSGTLAIFRKSWSTTHKSSDIFVLSLR